MSGYAAQGYWARGFAPGQDDLIVEPPLLTRTKTLYAPSVSTGEAAVSPPLITRTKVLFAPAVLNQDSVSPPLLTRSKVLYAPAVVPGAVSVAPLMITRAKTLYVPSVGQPSDQTVAPPLLTRTKTLFPPAVSETQIVVEVEELFIARPAHRNWRASKMPSKIGPIQTGEEKPAEFPFDDEGVSGSLASAEVSVTLAAGVDEDFEDVAVGSPSINGLSVIQKVAYQVPNAVYLLQCTATDSAGFKHTVSAYLASKAAA